MFGPTVTKQSEQPHSYMLTSKRSLDFQTNGNVKGAVSFCITHLAWLGERFPAR